MEIVPNTRIIDILTHWGRDEIDVILQTTVQMYFRHILLKISLFVSEVRI